jgi:hypothetical protein
MEEVVVAVEEVVDVVEVQILMVVKILNKNIYKK